MSGLGVRKVGTASRTPEVRPGKETELAIKEGGQAFEEDIYHSFASDEHGTLLLGKCGPSPQLVHGML